MDRRKDSLHEIVIGNDAGVSLWRAPKRSPLALALDGRCTDRGVRGVLRWWGGLLLGWDREIVTAEE
jgi:hypothetical protein